MPCACSGAGGDGFNGCAIRPLWASARTCPQLRLSQKRGKRLISPPRVPDSRALGGCQNTGQGPAIDPGASWRVALRCKAPFCTRSRLRLQPQFKPATCARSHCSCRSDFGFPRLLPGVRTPQEPQITTSEKTSRRVAAMIADPLPGLTVYCAPSSLLCPERQSCGSYSNSVKELRRCEAHIRLDPGCQRACGPPHAFTELGVAMLSSVLNSERAVQMNILIMRAFVRLRELMATHKSLRVHKNAETNVLQTYCRSCENAL